MGMVYDGRAAEKSQARVILEYAVVERKNRGSDGGKPNHNRDQELQHKTLTVREESPSPAIAAHRSLPQLHRTARTRVQTTNSTFTIPHTATMLGVAGMQPRQLAAQVLNFALVLSTAFMMWKGLSVVSDSPSLVWPNIFRHPPPSMDFLAFSYSLRMLLNAH